MHRHILLTLILGLFALPLLKAQSGDTKLAGQWSLQQVNISAEDDVLTPETSVFRDLYKTTNNLTLNADGTGSFLQDKQNKSITYEVVNAGTVKVFFQDVEKTSYNEYEFSITGTSLELRREDPVVQEVYLFNRVQ